VIVVGAASYLTLTDLIKELTFSFSKIERIYLFKTVKTGLAWITRVRFSSELLSLVGAF